MARPIALTKLASTPYVFEDNREDPVEEQTVFMLRPLPYAVRLKLMSTISMEAADVEGGKARATLDVGQRYDLACRYGIEGWSNYVGGDGEAVEPVYAAKKEYGMQVLDTKALAKLSDEALAELGNEIIERSQTPAQTVGE